MRRSVVLGVSAVLAMLTAPLASGQRPEKLDRSLDGDGLRSRLVRVIVQTEDPDAVERMVLELGGHTGRRLASVPGVVAELPSTSLPLLSANPVVRAVSLDRPLHGTLERTVAAIGARWIGENLGLDGAGIGVAIIDSGVTRAHEDLATKVAHFVDFVDAQSDLHDGYGHGTHVAGIIAGGGQSSDGARRGVAPGAHLVVLKALDSQGEGYISSAIAALDYAIEQRTAFNIRVINLSVAAGVHESYKTDPLTLAARRAVDAGMVVVTAAGNFGRSASGRVQSGGITAPGNAPWVLTVGASSHNGTVDRADDTVAPFSSLGPSAIDLVAKPDLVAPGVGIEAPADPVGILFATRPNARLWGTVSTTTEPYLSLSGTSMAAPVVAGTVALMLQANPTLAPAAVKAILQSTAESHSRESHLGQGAGFLNARAAVELARTFADSSPGGDVLDDLVDLADAEEGAWTAVCHPGDPECRYLNAACAASAGCFEHFGGAIAGVGALPEQTTVQGSGPERVRMRERRRAANE